MDRQVGSLIASFDHFVGVFDANRRFGGPSIYFHDRTLERLRSFGSPSEALLDDGFVESLYAVLTAWGMHRMGSRGARMEDFSAFRDSLRSQLPAIIKLDQHLKKIGGDVTPSLFQIPEAEVPILQEELWSVISGFKLGKSDEARIVIGSKAVHHLFPELLPPIDRRYTLRFFLDIETLAGRRERDAFQLIFPRFHRIAVECSPLIETLLQAGLPAKGYMRTSCSKMIDNAIVGFGIERLHIDNED
jgi:hypothetical protein